MIILAFTLDHACQMPSPWPLTFPWIEQRLQCSQGYHAAGNTVHIAPQFFIPSLTSSQEGRECTQTLKHTELPWEPPPWTAE